MNVPTTAPRISVERVSSATAKNRIMSIGFPKQSALEKALSDVLALVPEETEEQKAAKKAAKIAMIEAVRDNEPVISFKTDEAGNPDSQDWALLAAHPDRIGKVIIYGGGYQTLEQGARGGNYIKQHVRAPKAIIEAVMNAMGYKPSPTLYQRTRGQQPAFQGYSGTQPLPQQVGPQGYQPVGTTQPGTPEAPDRDNAEDFGF